VHLVGCTIRTVYINVWKTYHTKLRVQNGLPVDKHMMFATCRRCQELNSNINLKGVRLLVYVT